MAKINLHGDRERHEEAKLLTNSDQYSDPPLCLLSVPAVLEEGGAVLAGLLWPCALTVVLFTMAHPFWAAFINPTLWWCACMYGIPAPSDRGQNWILEDLRRLLDQTS